jgi:hypothetical protein
MDLTIDFFVSLSLAIQMKRKQESRTLLTISAALGHSHPSARASLLPALVDSSPAIRWSHERYSVLQPRSSGELLEQGTASDVDREQRR